MGCKANSLQGCCIPKRMDDVPDMHIQGDHQQGGSKAAKQEACLQGLLG